MTELELAHKLCVFHDTYGRRSIVIDRMIIVYLTCEQTVNAPRAVQLDTSYTLYNTKFHLPKGMTLYIKYYNSKMSMLVHLDHRHLLSLVVPADLGAKSQTSKGTKKRPDASPPPETKTVKKSHS